MNPILVFICSAFLFQTWLFLCLLAAMRARRILPARQPVNPFHARGDQPAGSPRSTPPRLQARIPCGQPLPARIETTQPLRARVPLLLFLNPQLITT